MKTIPRRRPLALATSLALGALGALGLLGLLDPTEATAGTSFTITVNARKVTAGAPEACQPQASTATAQPDSVAIEVEGKLTKELNVSIDGAGAPVVIKAGVTRAQFTPAVYANNRLLVMSGGKKVCELLLAPAPGSDEAAQRAAAVATATAAVATATADNAAFASIDQQARQFLESKGIKDHVVSHDSTFGRTIRLYHLPSGVPAFPLPQHLNEKDHLEIWVALPQDATADVEVSACDKVPAVRVGGSYTLPPGLKQSAEGDSLPPQFKLEPYAHKLNCSGTLTYKLDIAHQGAKASTTTSIAFDPVYRFDWGLGYMFDFGRPRHISLGDRPTQDGSGSEKFLVESRDYTGARPVIALGVNVCGTNPRELTWCDRLLNPTLLLDPSRLTSGFGAGLLLRPFHGVGLLAGVTVFKTTALADGVTTEVGDRWTIAGDPPTKEVFNRDSLGLVLAVVVSTDVFAELTKKAE